MSTSGARTLLMGGQACIFYGAAEFSRDLDLLVATDPGDLDSVREAIRNLQARQIAVPPFEPGYLERGHSIHLRCERADVAGLRIDLMSVLRECDPFSILWQRRVSIDVDGEPVDLMSLPDLVRAKKTQRDKDWPMIRRLMEHEYFRSRENPSEQAVHFLFRELRTSELLVELATKFPALASEFAHERPLIRAASAGNMAALQTELESEERIERQRDREYWLPLKLELERLRHVKRDK